MPRDCIVEIEIGGAFGRAVNLLKRARRREKKNALVQTHLVENESSRERQRFALPRW